MIRCQPETQFVTSGALAGVLGQSGERSVIILLVIILIIIRMIRGTNFGLVTTLPPHPFSSFLSFPLLS